MTLPQERLSEDHIVDFSNSFTRQLGIENVQAAFSQYHSHFSAPHFEVPSESAYNSAVALATKSKNDDSDDELPVMPTTKGNGKKGSRAGKGSKKGKASTSKGKKGKASNGKEEESSEDEDLQASLSILKSRGRSSSVDTEDEITSDGGDDMYVQFIELDSLLS